MGSLALLEGRHRVRSRRGATRRKLSLQAEGLVSNSSAAEVTIHDLSVTGLLLETSAELTRGEELDVYLPEAGATRARVIWSSGHYFGCQFDRPISSAVMSAAVLRSRPVAAKTMARQAVIEVASSQPNPTKGVDTEFQLSLGARLRIILALAIGCWVVIGLAAWALF